MPTDLAQTPTNGVAVRATGPLGEAIEAALVTGDLSKLSVPDRLTYYTELCRSLGLNPLTQPFQYLHLNGKLVLYANRGATDQLRRVNAVSVSILERQRVEDIYLVVARATRPDGRCDESTGAVAVGGLRGEALANALMKAETKAKRRVTLSICGLGWMDETEVDSVPSARRVPIEEAHGGMELPAPEAPPDEAEAVYEPEPEGIEHELVVERDALFAAAKRSLEVAQSRERLRDDWAGISQSMRQFTPDQQRVLNGAMADDRRRLGLKPSERL